MCAGILLKTYLLQRQANKKNHRFNNKKVVRYVGGYVAKSLIKKYEAPVALEFVICLSEMKVDGEGSDVLEYTRLIVDKKSVSWWFISS